MPMRIEQIAPHQTWRIRHEVMWPDRELDYVKLPEDDEGVHFGLYVEGKLVSVVSAFENGKEAQFRKFATLEAHQGKGYGSQLLNYLFEWLTEQGAVRIWCNARIEKCGFYERFGMVKTDETFQKGGKDYVVMERVI